MKKLILLLIVAMIFSFTACQTPTNPTGGDEDYSVSVGFKASEAPESRIAAAIASDNSLHSTSNVAADLYFGFSSLTVGKPYAYTNASFKLVLENDEGVSVSESFLLADMDSDFAIGMQNIPSSLFIGEGGEIYYCVEFTNGSETKRSDVITLYYANDGTSVALSTSPIASVSDVSADADIYAGTVFSLSKESRVRLALSSANGKYAADKAVVLKANLGLFSKNSTEKYSTALDAEIVASTLNGSNTATVMNRTDFYSLISNCSYNTETKEYKFGDNDWCEITLPRTLFAEKSGIIKLNLNVYAAGGDSETSNTVYLSYTKGDDGSVTIANPSATFKTYKVKMDLKGDKLEYASYFASGINNSYAPGERVEITLVGLTDAACTLLVNGTAAEYENGAFSFTMPSCDAVLEIVFN